MTHHILKRGVRFATVASAAVLVAACASQSDLPTANLAVARTSIAQAEADNAPRLAPIEYQNARDKLVRADEAVRSHRYGDARVLADESAADADVAQRKARSITARNTALEAQRSNAVLSSEINRTTQTTTTTVTPVPGTVQPTTQTTTTVVTQPQ